MELDPEVLAIKEACRKICERLMLSLTIKHPSQERKMFVNAVAYAGSRQVRRIYDVIFQDLVTTTLLADYLHHLVSLDSDNLRRSAVEQIAESTNFVSVLPSLISSVGAHCKVHLQTDTTRALVAELITSLHGIIAGMAHVLHNPGQCWQLEFSESGGILVLMTELSFYGHMDIASLQHFQLFGLPLVTLDILHCLAASNTLLPFFHSCDVVEILSPFLCSSPSVHPAFHLLALIVLSYCHAVIPDEKLLWINPTIASLILMRLQSKEIFQAVMQQCNEDDIPWSEIVTSDALYKALHNLALLSQDKSLFDENMLNAIQNSMQNGNNTEKIAALKLLCILSLQFNNEMKLLVDESLLALLVDAQNDKNETVRSLSLFSLNCIASDMDLMNGNEVYLNHVEMCYNLKLYDECIKLCCKSNFAASTQKVNSVHLLEAKALYHVYSSELTMSGASKLRNWTPELLGSIRKVIRLLTSAKENGYLNEEHQCMLDFALMDHLPATQSRSDVNICLLCLKKGKLEKSHVIPAAIYRDFVSGVSRPTSNKVILTNFLSAEWKYASPGQMAVYMLCKECEGKLSKIENNFLSKFFRQVYDSSNPNRTQQHQQIKYGTWLYQFAASLIFRGIAKCFSSDRVEISNYWQVYQVWLKCRHILECPEDFPGKKEENLPGIFLIILPTETYPGFENIDYVKWCKEGLEITTGIARNPGMQQLSTGRTAVHFIVKMGVFLFFTPYDELISAVMPRSTCIYPFGVNYYSIPEDQERCTTIPLEYIFQRIAGNECLTAKSQRIRAKRLEPHQMEPSILQQKTYNVPQDVCGESSAPAFPEIFSLLPPGFDIVTPIELKTPMYHRTSDETIQVPYDHHIVLHGTFVINEDTAHIFVGFSDTFQAFCLVCIVSPGSIQKHGFYFNLNDLNMSDVLPKSPKSLLDKLRNQFGSPSRKLIIALLTLKGFYHSSSLLHWYQSFRCYEDVVLDLKCLDRSSCWYCSSRCEHCLQRLQVYHQVQSDEGEVLKYCGKHFNPNATEVLTIFLCEKYPHEQMNVPSNHREVLRYTELNLGPYYCQVYVSLCLGNGSPEYPVGQLYIMLNIRHASGQCYLQFFVTDGLEPLENIDYSLGTTISIPEQEKEWKSIACDSLKQLYGQYFIKAFRGIS